MYLEKGREYYIEGDYYDSGGLFFLNLGLHKESTNLTKDDVPMAVQERQHLKIVSKIQEEVQVYLKIHLYSSETKYSSLKLK